MLAQRSLFFVLLKTFLPTFINLSSSLSDTRIVKTWKMTWNIANLIGHVRADRSRMRFDLFGASWWCRCRCRCRVMYVPAAKSTQPKIISRDHIRAKSITPTANTIAKQTLCVAMSRHTDERNDATCRHTVDRYLEGGQAATLLASFKTRIRRDIIHIFPNAKRINSNDHDKRQAKRDFPTYRYPIQYRIKSNHFRDCSTVKFSKIYSPMFFLKFGQK